MVILLAKVESPVTSKPDTPDPLTMLLPADIERPAIVCDVLKSQTASLVMATLVRVFN